jgi:electron transfer flavoprotein beta subunit
MSADTLAVLLSIGQNPVSGRPRRAERDARALSMALGTGKPVIGLHAGAPHDALHEYLGMGLPQLINLNVAGGEDPTPAIASVLSHIKPGLVLTGARAEIGDGSGLLPYAIANRLAMPVVPEIVSVTFRTDWTELLQAVPGARRRLLQVSGPAVVTVGHHGPPLRQIAKGPARRGVIEEVAVPESLPLAPNLMLPPLAERPARKRPKRIGPASESQSAQNRMTLTDPDAEAAAHAILSFLRSERFVLDPAREASQIKELAS